MSEIHNVEVYQQQHRIPTISEPKRGGLAEDMERRNVHTQLSGLR